MRIADEGVVRATLGKRKPEGGDQAHECTMSCTLVPRKAAPDMEWEIGANCWIEDSDGRKLFLHIPSFLLSKIVGSYLAISET